MVNEDGYSELLVRKDVLVKLTEDYSDIFVKSVCCLSLGWAEWFIATRTDEYYIYDEKDRTIRKIKNPCEWDEQDRANEFGKRLFRIMTILNVGQRELSRMSGVQAASIHRYIHGVCGPGLHSICLVAKALHCSVNDLIYDIRRKHDDGAWYV